MLNQPRSTQRYTPKKHDKDRALTRRIHELSEQHPRYGYRRIAALLRREGWEVNSKRVYRIWRKEGLQVPQRQHKRRRRGSSDNACSRRKAERPNQVWSYDFLFDSTESGHRLKMMPILDEYTRECLALRVDRSITSRDVIEELNRLMLKRGTPEFIRSDNGPEFVAKAVRRMLSFRGAEAAFIAPGAPWENAYTESFNSIFRDELLNRELFVNLAEAQVLIERWRVEYNEQRPHGSLDYRTPLEYAAELEETTGNLEPAEGLT